MFLCLNQLLCIEHIVVFSVSDPEKSSRSLAFDHIIYYQHGENLNNVLKSARTKNNTKFYFCDKRSFVQFLGLWLVVIGVKTQGHHDSHGPSATHSAIAVTMPAIPNRHHKSSVFHHCEAPYWFINHQIKKCAQKSSYI